MINEHQDYDLVVVGGGVNGTGVAADASGRGLKVLLCEMGDLAHATSSNSSKLIHGGLRYLEHYEFRLVREALKEREVLLNNAPHIMSPLRFQLPHQPHLRPALLIRMGLFLYDHLSKRVSLPASKSITFEANKPLIPSITKGFEYSDGWVDDARLVVLNALAAQAKGAEIQTRTKCVAAVRKDNLWQVQLKNILTGDISTIQTKAIVNAAGPWVSELFGTAIDLKSPQAVRLVRGSHIIVPKIHDGDQAFILQNADDRIVFVIPYEQDFSLIGTTDIEHQGDAASVSITDSEVDYLIEITNEYFTEKISKDDVVHTFSGVRPLLDDGSDSAQSVTRDYTFETDAPKGKAPLLSIFGGKITTYRKLAESATDEICRFFPGAGGSWTKLQPLPGGDFDSREQLLAELKLKYQWLTSPQLERYIRLYGTRTSLVLGDAQNVDDLGRHFGDNLYAKEIDYLQREEWAITIEDILWRRTKTGLRLSTDQIQALDDYLTRAC